jgi:hypothetical protein
VKSNTRGRTPALTNSKAAINTSINTNTNINSINTNININISITSTININTNKTNCNPNPTNPTNTTTNTERTTIKSTARRLRHVQSSSKVQAQFASPLVYTRLL